MKNNRFIYEELSVALNNNLVKKKKERKKTDIQSLILENHNVVIVVYTYSSQPKGNGLFYHRKRKIKKGKGKRGLIYGLMWSVD